MNTTINGSLPVIIEVLKKTSFNRYEIKFGTKLLSTKSSNSLIVGAKYWANVASDNGIININTLFKKEEIPFLEAGTKLINQFFTNDDKGFFIEFLKVNLAKTKDKTEFETLTNMLFALQQNVFEIPFFDGKNFGIMQIKNEKNITKLYLIYDIFPPINFEIKNGKIQKVKTLYKTLAKKLSLHFECEAEVSKAEKLFENSKNLVDFKG